MNTKSIIRNILIIHDINPAVKKISWHHKTHDAIADGLPSEILSSKSVELCAENDSWKLLCIPPLNFKVVVVQASRFIMRRLCLLPEHLLFRDNVVRARDLLSYSFASINIVETFVTYFCMLHSNSYKI